MTDRTWNKRAAWTGALVTVAATLLISSTSTTVMLPWWADILICSGAGAAVGVAGWFTFCAVDSSLNGGD